MMTSLGTDALCRECGKRKAEGVPSENECRCFPHVLHWNWARLGRKGQRCRILRNEGTRIHVEFEDGFNTIMDRRALRRSPPEKKS